MVFSKVNGASGLVNGPSQLLPPDVSGPPLIRVARAMGAV